MWGKLGDCILALNQAADGVVLAASTQQLSLVIRHKVRFLAASNPMLLGKIDLVNIDLFHHSIPFFSSFSGRTNFSLDLAFLATFAPDCSSFLRRLQAAITADQNQHHFQMW